MLAVSKDATSLISVKTKLFHHCSFSSFVCFFDEQLDISDNELRGEQCEAALTAMLLRAAALESLDISCVVFVFFVVFVRKNRKLIYLRVVVVDCLRRHTKRWLMHYKF